MIRLRPLLPALLLATSACAGLSGSSPAVDPVAAIQDEIEHYNDEELFACGNAALQASDFQRAAICFTRLADTFPQSPHHRDAQLNAGISLEGLQLWQLALERYLALLELPPPPGDLEAVWRSATAYYHLNEYDEAIALMAPLVHRQDLLLVDRIRAQTYMGICRVEKRELAEAEKDLRAAVRLYRRNETAERVETYYPSQAQFFLGEIYRLYFLEVSLENTDDPERSRDQLEYKAQLLLSAQGHYLRTMRLGDPHWAMAAGRRVGGLYEELYDEMMEAPVPSELDGELAELYRAALRRKVRVLVQKAIALYERTLSAAERIGVTSEFVEQTRRSLERMKQVLIEDAARDEEDGFEDLDEAPSPAGEDIDA